MLSTLALYLPQFHKVPENDEWWGEGFTEWTAVKGAKKLFDGHKQPRIPLDQYYYNLMDYDTMSWQAKLMKDYRIDGMCIYHYWFDNGRRILEKPAENLLKWKDIHMPFCFCWANQTWSRTWKKLSETCTWSSVYEKKKNIIENKGILLKQTYGREKNWEEHFQYLLPFFQDDRYIKLNGMPVFVIYRVDDIPSLWNMIHYFNKRAYENNLPGIFVIGMLGNRIEGVNAVCLKQPEIATGRCIAENGDFPKSVTMYSYDEIWDAIINEKSKAKKTYFCGIVDFDNSPRMGENSIIIKDASPTKFYHYFKTLYEKSILLDNEFIFINAWNEWGEGMYLEPDEMNKYGYLECIKKVVTEFEQKKLKKKKQLYSKINLQQEISEKNQDILRRHDLLLDNWICLKEKDIEFSTYFKKYNYQVIAIYGMGKLGKHLYNELKKGDIQVLYGIDKNRNNIDCDLKIYLPNEQIPQVDAVVITIIDQYVEIGELLRRNLKCAMITIEEIVQELLLDN